MAESIHERIIFKAGDRIFSEGEKGYRAFIIQEGEVEIIKEIDNKETVLATVGKGGIIGEMALIDDSPRMASARGVSGGVVVVVTADMFKEKMDKTDPFIRGLLRILADHSRNLSKENVSLKSRLGDPSPKPEKQPE